MEEPKKLQKTIRFGGFEYHQVKRNKYAIIYEQFDILRNKALKSVGYETHQIRIKKAQSRNIPKGNGIVETIYYPLREIWASNNEFGEYGWSYDTLGAAERKYKEITKWCSKK
jgi:hypothetical protein